MTPEADCWLHPGDEVCRGTVTGADWRRADLRARCGEHWIPMLLAWIAGGRADPAESQASGGPDLTSGGIGVPPQAPTPKT